MPKILIPLKGYWKKDPFIGIRQLTFNLRRNIWLFGI
jgi:hypothetical protein